MHLLYIQFGDFMERFGALRGGAPESYRSQAYSVDFIARQATSGRDVTIFSLENKSDHCALIPNLFHEGIPYYQNARLRLLLRLLAIRPSHIILRTPILPVLAVGLMLGADILPLFADSFRASGLWPRLRTKILVWLLNRPAIRCVANHNLAACEDLRRAGVRPEKIIPWDWPHSTVPEHYSVKRITEDTSKQLQLLYVGALRKDKGVWDCVAALGQLIARGVDARLTVIGSGDTDALEDFIQIQSLADHVFLEGSRPHEDVLRKMRAADLVLVPSHHSYGEGLPGTIYEALAVRTPVIMSDHPMFTAYFKDGEGVKIFPAKNATAMASTVESATANSDIYAELSASTVQAYAHIACDNTWGEVIDQWLCGDPQGWIANRTLGHRRKELSATADL